MAVEFYGALVGDMVGSVYEHHNIKTKDFPLWHADCFATDDSIMTLAIADTLSVLSEPTGMSPSVSRLDIGGDDFLRDSFVRGMRRIGQNYPYCGYGGGFRRWMYAKNPRPYNSCGNGSAMRVSPVAYFARTMEECERFARLSADVTHNHPDGIAGAQATAGAVFLALHGASKKEIKEYVERYYPIGFTLDEIREEYYFGRFQATCAGTVPYAVEAFLESTDFEDCIRNTISIGGDSDTLAAISGAIAEAYYGTPVVYRGAVLGRLPGELRSVFRRVSDNLEDWRERNPRYFADLKVFEDVGE